MSRIIEIGSARVLDLNLAGTPVMPAKHTRPFAWSPADLVPSDWTIKLHRVDFEQPFTDEGNAGTWPALGQVMRKVDASLRGGAGFAIVDRLPVDRLSESEAIDIYAKMGARLGRQVPTKFDGTLFYKVTDEGRSFGPGVRGSSTSAELSFHTDNAFAEVMPEFVGLLCLQTAKSGGVSRICNLYDIHDRMLKAEPRLLRRLYAPALFDRQREHDEGAPLVLRAPVLEFSGGALRARLVPNLIRRGYEMTGLQPDRDLIDALHYLECLLADPANSVEFTLEPGQILYVANHGIAHARTRYVDGKEPRLMIRTWYRAEGAASYDGEELLIATGGDRAAG